QLVRPLRDFGPLGTRLGVGEIGLVEDPASLVTIYEQGINKRSEAVDVLPPVAVADELAEAQQLHEPVQALATELVRQVLATTAVEVLPQRVQRNLIRAALARRIDPDVLLP